MLLRVPAQLADNCAKTGERAAWLGGLPNTLHELERRWALNVHEPFDGPDVSCAWVAPVTLRDGGTAVLKVPMPHFESAGEIDSLRFWRGDPTVELLRSDDQLGAMLLEPCDPGTPLRVLPESRQDALIARLLLRLWRPPSAPHPFRPLSALMSYWSDETLASIEQWPDPGLVRESLKLFKELPSTAAEQTLLATDLHAGNVLRSQREPWLVIDPKPFVGDPAFDVTQHLLNCRERVLADPNGMISRMADLTEQPFERVQLWLFARAAAKQSAESLRLARAIARHIH